MNQEILFSQRKSQTDLEVEVERVVAKWSQLTSVSEIIGDAGLGIEAHMVRNPYQSDGSIGGPLRLIHGDFLDSCFS